MITNGSLEKTLRCYPITNDTVLIPIEALAHVDLHPFNGVFLEPYCNSYPKIYYEKIEQSGYKLKVKNIVISAYLYEPASSGDASKLIHDSLRFCQDNNFFPNLKNVYILYDSFYINLDSLSLNYNIQKVHIDYFLLRSYFTDYKSSYKFLSSSFVGKPLFLIGDPNRFNRFPLLLEFYKNNSLDKIQYSLTHQHYCDPESLNSTVSQYLRKDDKIWLLDYMKSQLKVDDYELIKIFESLITNIPNDLFYNIKKNIPSHFDISAYYFTEEWLNSSLIIVSETYFTRPLNDPFLDPVNNISLNLSEKTFKPLVTCKPFLHLSQWDWIEKHLEKMGFQTFLKFTSYPNYIEEFECEDNQLISYHCKILHDRIVSFTTNFSTNKEQIINTIQYNYTHWLNLCEHNWKNLYKSCPALNPIAPEALKSMFLIGSYGKYVAEFLESHLSY